MTKNQYLDELKKELKSNNVPDMNDIIAEYEEHFKFKIEEGKTEEEIARKLSSPKEIAKEYAKINISINKYEKSAKITGLTFLSIPLSLVYIMICASVVVLGAFSITSLVTGFCLITTLNIAGLIPNMPYFSSFMLGIAFIGLAIIATIGTIYLFLYVKQWGKIYIRWCKNIVNNNRYPSISKHPNLSKRFIYILRLISIIGLVCFISTFIIAYCSMAIDAKSIEFWHVWHWFV